ncbi:general stress protein [Mammaliicoccus sp. Dog046]|uniref:general stress protein n=1 Tax=Mammaliicoccus sp. Dog046 TaxID=3034233 RepID=UPI002B259302|nr:general stress protein [Mammaliicoccus sp. Dog046]WQK85778.1 general stress protein [Mammaliicoccus sp. Dog046]
MIPVVKAYTNEKDLEADINTLKDQGISQKDIYILTENEAHTERIVEETEYKNINYNRKSIGGFEYKEDELLRKLEVLNVAKPEAERYVEDIKQGKVILIVTDQRIKGVL